MEDRRLDGRGEAVADDAEERYCDLDDERLERGGGGELDEFAYVLQTTKGWHQRGAEFRKRAINSKQQQVTASNSEYSDEA